MPVLPSTKHEHFAQGIAKGLSPMVAYVAAGYSKAGARFGAWAHAFAGTSVDPFSNRLRRTS
jgi:hypothetical protein